MRLLGRAAEPAVLVVLYVARRDLILHQFETEALNFLLLTSSLLSRFVLLFPLDS